MLPCVGAQCLIGIQPAVKSCVVEEALFVKARNAVQKCIVCDPVTERTVIKTQFFAQRVNLFRRDALSHQVIPSAGGVRLCSGRSSLLLFSEFFILHSFKAAVSGPLDLQGFGEFQQFLTGYGIVGPDVENIAGMFVEQEKPGGGAVFIGFFEGDHVRCHTADLRMFHLVYVFHDDLAVDAVQFRHGVDGHDGDPAVVRLTSVLAGAAVAHAFRQIAGLYLIFSGDQVIVEIKFIGEAVGLLLYISLKVGYCRIYA